MQPLAAWPSSESGYQLGRILGKGSSSTVQEAYCPLLDKRCAIKRIDLESKRVRMEDTIKEIRLMESCQHQNIISYHTSFVVGSELWIVVKLSAGSLLDVIEHSMEKRDCTHGVLDEVTIATLLKEVLKGLEHFHKNGNVHRDLKSGNILLGLNGEIQIGDLGCAETQEICRKRNFAIPVGTPCWIAPEVLEQGVGYDSKVDIWSLGITAIELVTGSAPYRHYQPMEIYIRTMLQEPPTLDFGAKINNQYKKYSNALRKMISNCLQKDPKKRPTATQLLKNTFFKKAKDKQFLVETLLKNDVLHLSNLEKPLHQITMHRESLTTWNWSFGNKMAAKLVMIISREGLPSREQTFNFRLAQNSLTATLVAEILQVDESLDAEMVTSNVSRLVNEPCDRCITFPLHSGCSTPGCPHEIVQLQLVS
ncbi:STK39 [Cordylochernes scorpioides]|uniref:non-specific serine/threonine protein kinase n=1 Tax=Cordylochernes scorpioides TaxID=51811 RepID=A0ABY6KFX5_9ARAC|nr:STK39 [Cordylochernes scorpioides]